MKTIKISDKADLNLSHLSESRKDRGEIIKTKQDIVADLIAKAHDSERFLK